MLGIKKPQAARSVIGADMKVQGPCSFSASLQIDGEVLGDVVADPPHQGTLVIGPGGKVTGAICAAHVVIAGKVQGPVQAHELLELQAQAQIEGDVQYKALDMQPGAVVIGQLQPQLLTPLAPPPADLPEPASALAAPAEDAPPPQAAAPAAAAAPGEPQEPTLEPGAPLLPAQDKNQLF